MKIASAENLFSSNLIFRIQGTFVGLLRHNDKVIRNHIMNNPAYKR